ncbi:MAG: NADPH-dependent 7-cyano-7-deazaguanine reductase QueF [Spirochaetes bacterium]|nr:NADPH-dependent 7-cyano-7-deazaguanine reductase QueF [Spirochaetota bacterium]
MPLPEGKTFEFESEEAIRSDFLEAIDYDGNRQEITCETDEFSAVCPFSGLPDIGRVSIIYVPRRRLVELKSLKYYFVSFRNAGIYQEAATDRIFRDLRRLLDPEYLMVRTVYNIRGGIASTCVMDSEKLGPGSPGTEGGEG